MGDLEEDLRVVILEYCERQPGHEVSFAEFFDLHNSVEKVEERTAEQDMGNLVEKVLHDLEQEGYIVKTTVSPDTGSFRCYEILKKDH